MDDYGYHQQLHEHPFPLYPTTSALPSALSASNNGNASLGLYSEGLIPAIDQLQNDLFFIQSDQERFHNMMVNEDFDQFDPIYASLDIPIYDSPVSPSSSQVCGGRLNSESSESLLTKSFEGPLLRSDTFVTNESDTGVKLQCHEVHQPMQLISSHSYTKECESVQSIRHEKGRQRSTFQMRESKTNGSLNNSVADSLTWEMLSQYFYMPIAQAARELNIGLTLFKRRCRELGVRRWPHRKLMSIQSLINNVKEMEKDGGMDPPLSKVTVRNAIKELENQRKLMEVMPDIELESQTKRLRQECFKANYKKRRLIDTDASSNQCNASNTSFASVRNEGCTNV